MKSDNTIEQAISDFKAGKMVMVVDDKDRENEGDLVLAGEKVTTGKINFMVKEGRGLVCVPLANEIVKRLDLPQMVCDNTEKFQTAFTVSLDVKSGVTTGISASDRARTIKKLADLKAKKSDFVFPGHIFPLRSISGGVLKRQGHTEAAIDLCRITKQKEVAVVCEILKSDGSMAREEDLKKFSKKHGLKIISISDLALYRKKNEKLVTCLSRAELPTKFGSFKILAFKSTVDKQQHVVLLKGNVKNKENVLLRIHSECLTGEALFSNRCDCGRQLEKSLRLIQKEKQGIVIYLKQEGRGIGLLNKIRAYSLQDKGLDTVEANKKLGFVPDLREYSLAAQIIKELGVLSVYLLTNNPKKIKELKSFGIKVQKRVPLETKPTPENRNYLETKKERMGHLINHLND